MASFREIFVNAQRNTKIIWSFIGVLVVADIVLGSLQGLSIAPARFLQVLAGTVVMLGLSYLYTFHRKDPRIATLTHLGAVTLAFTTAAAVLSYITVIWGRPLIDRYLVQMDHAIGFDWITAYDWLKVHRALYIIFGIAYFSLIIQMLVLLVTLNFLRMMPRSWELMWLFIITSMVCIIISAFLPASGAYGYFQIGDDPYVHAFSALRNGSLKVLGAEEMQGVVQFPSLHIALAIVFIYCARGVKILFPVLVVLNILLALGTPAFGGHHLTDMTCGAIVALLAILAVRHVPVKE